MSNGETPKRLLDCIENNYCVNYLLALKLERPSMTGYEDCLHVCKSDIDYKKQCKTYQNSADIPIIKLVGLFGRLEQRIEDNK